MGIYFRKNSWIWVGLPIFRIIISGPTDPNLSIPQDLGLIDVAGYSVSSVHNIFFLLSTEKPVPAAHEDDSGKHYMHVVQQIS